MIEILKNKAGLFIFQLKDKEGKIILRSDGYTQKINCQKGISSMKRNSKNPERIELMETKPSGWRINMKAGNGQTTAQSEIYKAEAEAKDAVKIIMNIVPTADIRDLTKN